MTVAPNQLQPLQRMSAHKLALWLAGPVAAIVLMAIGAAAWILLRSAGQIDRHQIQHEDQLVRTAFATESKPVSQVARDYAIWDDTYDQFSGTLVLNWTAENLGPYLNKTYGIDYTFVFSRSGDRRYASIPDGQEQLQLGGARDRRIDRLMLYGIRRSASALLKAWDRDAIEAIHGYTTIEGIPAFVAIHVVRPNSPERAAKEAADHVLVLIKLFDAARLQEMMDAFNLKDLSISSHFKLSLPALEPHGQKIGAVWAPGRLGAQFAQETAAALLPVSTAAVALLFLAVLGWWKAVGSVRNAELQALNDRARSVQETARAKSLFVANMSHELRTPLNAIIGFSEVIKSQILGPLNQPKYVEYACDIHSSGKHLLGIVNNILTLSKIEAQQQRIRIEDVGVVDLAAEAIRMCMPDAAKRGIRIETYFDGAPVARADAQALTQIAVNLLSNAIKFSEPDGEVRISAGVRAGTVALKVEDRGCGIPPETLAQLGRPFTQAEDPYRRNYQGTGLGLSICFALAREMNGELQIQSELGVGAAATLTLPLAAVQAETARPAPRAA